MSEQPSSYPHSHLFTVRLWSEDMGSAGTVLRGEVRHVRSGGMRYFQEWTTLVAYLTEKVQELENHQKGSNAMTCALDGEPD